MKRTIGSLQQAYVKLWTAFSDAAAAQNLRADAAAGIGAVVSQGADGVVATATLFLPGWPQKVVSSKKSKAVDIAVMVNEVFSADLAVLNKATTQVGYFERKDVPAPPYSKALLELHYDFETPVCEAHPVFHAQIGATEWPEDSFRRLGMVGKVERDEGTHYGNARIPTAFVGFAGILVALAADHLKPGNFRRMMRCARENDQGRADPECSWLLGGLKSSAVPHGHHWYDERWVVHVWQEKKRFLADVPVLKNQYEDKDRRRLQEKVFAALGAGMKDVVFREGRPTTAT